MAGRFTAVHWAGISVSRRTYPNTPGGHLEAARDKVNGRARIRGHKLGQWSKTGFPARVYTAVCRDCGAGVAVAAGRAPMNRRGYPTLLDRGRIMTCPGMPERGRRGR